MNARSDEMLKCLKEQEQKKTFFWGSFFFIPHFFLPKCFKEQPTDNTQPIYGFPGFTSFEKHKNIFNKYLKTLAPIACLRRANHSAVQSEPFTPLSNWPICGSISHPTLHAFPTDRELFHGVDRAIRCYRNCIWIIGGEDRGSPADDRTPQSNRNGTHNDGSVSP